MNMEGVARVVEGDGDSSEVRFGVSGEAIPSARLGFGDLWQ